MNNFIDITFDSHSDTPPGKDPDSFSPTLRNYHRILWSKPLPSGVDFNLNHQIPKVLYHNSQLGEFILSSDAIGHTYRKWKMMAPIIKNLSSDEVSDFAALCRTIGGYIIFPAKKVDNKMTINGARGLNKSIKDRFDLTLECIRLHYCKESSPLSETFNRYTDFFNLFIDFKGYVDFFLLQDLVDRNYKSIQFWIPFKSFDDSPLPKSIEDYTLFKKNLMSFIRDRNNRIHRSSIRFK